MNWKTQYSTHDDAFYIDLQSLCNSNTIPADFMGMCVKTDRLILKSIWNFKWQEKRDFPE